MDCKTLLITFLSFNHILAISDNDLTSKFVVINNRESEEVEVRYPNNMRSERALPICAENEVCSVIHKRFWFKPRVERLCRCSNLHKCPREWNSYPHNKTMALNNLSQLKFCGSLFNLADCGSQNIALSMTIKEVDANIAGSTVNSVKIIKHRSLVVQCYCPESHYWKINRVPNKSKLDIGNSVTTFRCANLKRCESKDFCGYVRADTYSSYYRCSCPVGHLCLITNRTLQNVSELLYNGLAYQANCEPFLSNLT